MKLSTALLLGTALTATAALADTTATDETVGTGAATEMETEFSGGPQTASATEMEDSEDGATVYSSGFLTEFMASDLLGARIYTIEGDLADQEWFDPNGGWRDIGEIDDIVIARDGGIESVSIDLGGFLGINENSHTIAMDVLQFYTEEVPENDGDYFVVISEEMAQTLSEG
ncbi:MAG: PRC-barrel domain-containing protein [Pseudomonadota bacterium]